MEISPSASTANPSIADDLPVYLGTDQELDKILNSFVWAEEQGICSSPLTLGATPSSGSSLMQLQPLPAHLLSSNTAPIIPGSTPLPSGTSTATPPAPDSPFSSASSDSETVLHKTSIEDTTPPARHSRAHPKRRRTIKRNDIPANVQLPIRKGGMHLWQFLYGMLLQPGDYSDLIEWTSNKESFEFRLLEPEAIAMWWGYHKNKTNMSYDKLSRSLRYYYDKCIIRKMAGERYVYRFCVDPELMYNALGNSENRPQLKPLPHSVKVMLLESQQQPKEPVASCSRLMEEINPLLRHHQSYSSPEYSPISLDIPGACKLQQNYMSDFSPAASSFSPSIVAYGRHKRNYSSPEFSPTSQSTSTRFSYSTPPTLSQPIGLTEQGASSFSPTLASSPSMALTSPSYSPPIDHLVSSSYGIESSDHDIMGKCLTKSNQQAMASIFPDVSCCHAAEPQESFFPYSQHSTSISSNSSGIHMSQLPNSTANPAPTYQQQCPPCPSYCSPPTSTLSHYPTKESDYFNLEAQFTLSTVPVSSSSIPTYSNSDVVPGSNFTSEYHSAFPLSHFSNSTSTRSDVDSFLFDNDFSLNSSYEMINAQLIPN
uniref:ETS domain-containing protein n=1 Tax=Amphimedon queenslandica TaxID=400682 RepID=A0A1X7VC56_AMPQE